MTKRIVLTKDKTSDNDYVLKRDCEVWISVGNLSVTIRHQDEGVVVDVWPLKHMNNEPIASTWATFSDGDL